MKLNIRRGFSAGTMISTIEVPLALKRRVPTGIEWFDDAVGGQGYTPTSTVMLTGGPGTGKSTLVRQMASSLAASPNILPFYNTGEESLYQAKWPVSA